MKRMTLIIIAIIFTLLLCWANFYVILETADFMHAGWAALIPFAFTVLLHALLLFVLIKTVKLPLGYMLLVWGVLIALYSFPVVKLKYDNWKSNKELAAKDDVRQRLYTGMATMSDFQYLFENDDDEIIITALENGYSEIAKEILAEFCNPSSDRIFCNSANKSERLHDVEVYGKELARQKYLRQLYFRLEEKELTEGVEYLLAKEGDIINMDTVEFMLLLSDKAYPIGGINSQCDTLSLSK